MSSRSRSEDDELIIQTMPHALRLARKIARRYRVRALDHIEDCEQVACKALLEARLSYDKTRGSFSAYAWKRVYGAVLRHLRKERAAWRIGLSNALAAADELRDPYDPFEDEDDDVCSSLKADCRRVTFARFMGDTSAALAAHPEHALLRARTRAALTLALGELDEPALRLLELRYWERLTWPEVAASLGVDERQAKRIDERLRERLRRDLHRRGEDAAPPSARA